MSRVSITPPSSSTGTLNAAQIPSLTSTLANLSQSGSVWMSRMAADSRWLNATAHGPWASRSCSSSRTWAVWSVALAQRSWPSAVDQHQPGRVGSEQLFGPVGDLLQGAGQALFGVQAAEGADAVGQIGGIDGHGAPCLSAVQGTGEPGSRPGSRRRGCRAARLALRCHRPDGTRRIPTTRITVRRSSPSSNRLPTADRLLSGPAGYTAHAASGREPPRSGPSRRAGWPKPRWPASLARGCLHPEHSGKRRPSSGGDLQAALGIRAGCSASNWITPDGSRLAMNRVEFCAHRPAAYGPSSGAPVVSVPRRCLARPATASPTRTTVTPASTVAGERPPPRPAAKTSGTPIPGQGRPLRSDPATPLWIAVKAPRESATPPQSSQRVPEVRVGWPPSRIAPSKPTPAAANPRVSGQ